MKYKAMYDIIIVGSKDRVKDLAKKYNVELVKETFAKDDGYSFEVYEEAVRDHPFVQELYKYSEVISIVRAFTAMF